MREPRLRFALLLRGRSAISAAMRIRPLVVTVSLAALATLSGCWSPKAALPPDTDFSSLAIPLDVRDANVSRADGQHAVFLKLTRVPDQINDRIERDPLRIVVEILGPTGGEDLERVLSGGDGLISRIIAVPEASRILVEIELNGTSKPDYEVRGMADWIMVRIDPGASK